MKILVKSRQWMKNQMNNHPDFDKGKWIISIYSNDSQSPFLPRFNILQLCFDDVTEKDTDGIHFNKDMAKQIIDFIKDINDDNKPIYVHCDAGVSRSGAVGYMINEWFNKYLEMNEQDNQFFINENKHILPNPEVMRILKSQMFGDDYRGVFVNDYSYNSDGERINNIQEI